VILASMRLGTRAAIKRWYERLPRVLARGNDRGCRMARVGHTLDGQPYTNQGVHFTSLRWGRTTAIRIYCERAGDPREQR
jgi:hypothetical protein